MTTTNRYKLHFGPYVALRFKYGDVDLREFRGDVTIVGETEARIPWPIGKIAGVFACDFR